MAAKRKGGIVWCLLLAGLLLLAVTPAETESRQEICFRECLEAGDPDFICASVCGRALQLRDGTGAGGWEKAAGEIIPVEESGAGDNVRVTGCPAYCPKRGGDESERQRCMVTCQWKLRRALTTAKVEAERELKQD
ncbi:hypothetical protein VPH35_092623 [Triticum aestivum]